MAAGNHGRERAAREISSAWERLRPESWELDPSEVRRVCVILAAPRSGSSFLFHLLSRHPAFIAPSGEDTPFCRLHQTGWVDRLDQSDRLEGIPADAPREIARWILRDCGKAGGTALERSLDLTRRLLLQWPELAAREQETLAIVRETVALGGAFLPKLAARLPEIAIGAYDDASATLARVPAPDFAGRPFFFEEPPFVVPSPRAPVSRADLREKILVLKSSTNAYRLPLVLKYFPKAEYRFIVLSRNPLGGINGLIDGWRSPHFHSHRVGDLAPLDVAGYTRASRPSTRAWWKFDLPPGWAAFTGSPLADLCSFQWTSANRAIAESRKLLGRAYDLKYETMLEPESFAAAIELLFAELGVATEGVRELVARHNVSVMSVRPPASGRWKARRRTLLPLLSEPALREAAGAMGYDLRNPERLA